MESARSDSAAGMEWSDSTMSLAGIGMMFVEGTAMDGAADEASVLAEVRGEMARAVSTDTDYWERLSSAVLAAEVASDDFITSPNAAAADGSQAKPMDLQRYALHWARYGRGANIIGDVAAHRATRQERFERREAKKSKKAQFAAARQQLLASGGQRAQQDLARALQQQRAAQQRAAQQAAESAALSAPIRAVLRVDPNATLAILQQLHDRCLHSIDDGVLGPDDLPSLSSVERDAVVASFDFMLDVFQHRRFKQRYNATTAEGRQGQALKAGSDVPSYFANVGGESMFRRKQLSMAGLRNLILYGPVVYTQMRDHLFSGRLADYSGDEGPQLMRRVTGNVVDLDWTVLRCNDRPTLNAINASNAHREALKKKGALTADQDQELYPQYSSAEQFGQSKQAAAIATTVAKDLIHNFCQVLKLDPVKDHSQLAKRHLIVSDDAARSIPTATNNTDRGNSPIWHYVNCGQDSFHANVPNLADVNGALIKAPFHCAMAWCQLLSVYGPPGLALTDPKQGYTGSGEEDTEGVNATDATFDAAEFDRRLDVFFEDCIADACFNLKWKAIEAYCEAVTHEGTIVDVLQRTQAAHQHIFTAAFFDADDEDTRVKEIAAMWALAEGKVAKSVISGRRMRPITEQDVAAWVLDPAVEL